MTRLFSIKHSLAAVSAAVLLAACGGGGSDYTLKLTGVAATGLAIEGGDVEVQCVSGTGTASTDSAGVYTVSVVNGEGPCLVTVSKDGLTLRSIAQPDPDGQAVANVTPITDAIVNAIALAKGITDLTDLTDLLDDQIPTADDIEEAATAVVAVLNQALKDAGWEGPDLTADQLLDDSTFKAATESDPNAGTIVDQAMDLLIPLGETSLPEAVIEQIDQAIDEVVDPTPTLTQS